MGSDNAAALQFRCRETVGEGVGRDCHHPWGVGSGASHGWDGDVPPVGGNVPPVHGNVPSIDVNVPSAITRWECRCLWGFSWLCCGAHPQGAVPWLEPAMFLLNQWTDSILRDLKQASCEILESLYSHMDTQAGEEFESSFKVVGGTDRAEEKCWLCLAAVSSVLWCSSLRHCLGRWKHHLPCPSCSTFPAHPRSQGDPGAGSWSGPPGPSLKSCSHSPPRSRSSSSPASQ